MNHEGPTDEERIAQGVRQAEAEGRVISDAVARVIAAQMMEPRAHGYNALATSGAILDDELSYDIGRDLSNPDLDAEAKRWIGSLLAYAVEAGPREPLPGWSNLWPGKDNPEFEHTGYGSCAVCGTDMPAGSEPHTYEEDPERLEEVHPECCNYCNPPTDTSQS